MNKAQQLLKELQEVSGNNNPLTKVIHKKQKKPKKDKSDGKSKRSDSY